MADDLLNVFAGGGPTRLNGLDVIPQGMSPMEFFLRQTPGWKFAKSQAQRATLTGAGAMGTLLKRPGTLGALSQYSQGVADQTYGNQVGRYFSLADLGLRGATAPFI